MLFVVTLGLGWIVWAIVLGRTVRTSAKQILHTWVIDARTGAPATGRQMLARELVGILATLALGFLTCGVGLLFAAWLVFSPSRQTMWDRIAGTTVAKAP